MREIKFRGKRVDNGTWVTGYYVKFYGPATGRGDFIHDVFGCVFEVIPETVGQFTTKKDHNGREIYEDDWVVGQIEYDLGGSPEQENIEIDTFEGVVMWHPDAAGFDVDTKGDGLPEVNLESLMDHIEIIGNIHENKELLNEMSNT